MCGVEMCGVEIREASDGGVEKTGKRLAVNIGGAGLVKPGGGGGRLALLLLPIPATNLGGGIFILGLAPNSTHRFSVSSAHFSSGASWTGRGGEKWTGRGGERWTGRCGEKCTGRGGEMWTGRGGERTGDGSGEGRKGREEKTGGET